MQLQINKNFMGKEVLGNYKVVFLDKSFDVVR